MKTVLTIVGSLLVGVAAMYLFAQMQDTKSESYVTVNSISKVAKLAMVEYNVSVIEERKKELKVVLKWKTAKFLVLLSGIVTGSVDLKNAKININKETKKVDIVFGKGAVKVSQPASDPKAAKFITITDRKLFKRLNSADFTAGYGAANKKLRNTALDGGIVKKTKEEAIELISNFLLSLGYSANIKFK